MYHYVVARKLRAVFAAISRGDTRLMLDTLAERFTYRFEGDSAIGGVRNSRRSMQLWWERMYRLFPGFRLEVRDVLVAGPPWNTRIHTQLDFVMPMPAGGSYHNVVMQVMHMRWGRVTAVHTLEDTQRAARLLEWMAARGQGEAVATAISDTEWPQAGPFMGGGAAPA
ncbi:MAG: nuclear transport factor 2 family protein [Ramlibacter sp.]